ncbi:hypothetical protein PSCT_02869 [Pseudomonas sp. SCT]|uniref:helix-turn-helix transcriptional regulator n=1 Tax=Pseudomonas sp. (strain SCT) TaxID=412955 RepID=UPI000EE71709|nr:AlpA family phage regulatory protein [Pseudomonas sp. SCT]GCA56661.1 hypothetical protein PSCT_02869 [Pseudomonas sp. SCT]
MKQKKPANPPAPLLFTMAEVMELLKYKSRQAVYDLLRRDETFPRPRRTPTGYLVWLSAEVFAWVSALPVAEFTGADAIEAHALRELEAAR